MRVFKVFRRTYIRTMSVCRSRWARAGLCTFLSFYTFWYLLTIMLHDEVEEFRDVPIHPVPLNESMNLTIDDLNLIDIGSYVSLSRDLVSQHSSQYAVPKIVHQSWNDYNIPVMTAKWVQRWKVTNPNWKYMFWTDKTSREFMAQYFPDYLPLYDGFLLPVQKADLFRYFVLFAIGGVYADLDVEPLRSLDEITAKNPCVLGQEPEAHFRLIHPNFGTPENNYTLSCNAFMFCRPRHPFMAYLINEIVERRKKVPDCKMQDTLLCTGPYILSTAWVKYKAIIDPMKDQYPENDVTCPDPDYFLPTWDPLRTGWIRVLCLVKKRYDKLTPYNQKLCDRLKEEKFQNQPRNWSYTNHHWFHSWTEERVRYLSKRYSKLHISKVVPEILYGGEYVKL